MSKKFLLTSALLLILSSGLLSFDNSDFRTEDKIRIKEARSIFNEYGNSLWADWEAAPFAILIVTHDNEYLMFHPEPTDDFITTGYDSIIQSEVYKRPRQFSNNFLATFPAVNGVPTIVVGTPENTSRTSLSWTLTLLHEHFHQLQSSKPDYYSAVESLDLSGGDQSGMWMLNYDFPYDDEIISDQYSSLTHSAKKTFLTIDKPEFENSFKEYLSTSVQNVINFKSLLSLKSAFF